MNTQQLAFINENGVVLNNDTIKAPYIMSLPAVGVDSPSWTYIYALSKDKDIKFTISESETNKYYFLDNASKETIFVKELNSKGKELPTEKYGYNYIHIITLVCNIDFKDTDNALSTYSISCCVNCYDTENNILNNIIYITEFVEKSTSEILINNGISKNIDRFIINAVNNHDADSNNPDILLYNRKLKELLMNYNQAGDSTYKQLFNILELFGFDNIQIYDILKTSASGETYNYKTIDPLYCNKTHLLEEYIKTYNIFIGFKLWEYSTIKGNRLTQTDYIEFESDKFIHPIKSTKQENDLTEDDNQHDYLNDNGFEYVSIYPNTLERPYNDITKDDQTNILVNGDGMSDEHKNVYRTESPLNCNDVNTGAAETYESDDVKIYTPNFGSTDDKEGVKLELVNGYSVIMEDNGNELDGFDKATMYKPLLRGNDNYKIPEVVPMINRKFDNNDYEATITSDELQEKTRLIKSIINDNFSSVYNNIFGCAVQDATYADNLKIISTPTTEIINSYNNKSIVDDRYNNYLNNEALAGDFIPFLETEYKNMKLSEYLSTYNKYSLITGRLNPTNTAKYYIDEYHNTISNSSQQPFNNIKPMPVKQSWSYYGTFADVKPLNFKELYKLNPDIKYIEIFVVKTVYDTLISRSKADIHQLIEDIKTNATVKGYNADHQYSYSLHEVSPTCDANEIILMKDDSDYHVYVQFYSNLFENPICELNWTNRVLKDKTSTPVIRELAYKYYTSQANKCDIQSIFHNDNIINTYNEIKLENDITEYYSKSLRKEFLHKLKVFKLNSCDINNDADDSVSIQVFGNTIIVTTLEVFDVYDIDEYFDNEQLLNITKDINENILNVNKNNTLCLSLSINSPYTFDNRPENVKYTIDDIYVSVHSIRPNTDIDIDFGSVIKPIVFEYDIFYPRAWRYVNGPIKNINDIKTDKLYIIENINGSYTNTDNTYTIRDANYNNIVIIPTAGIIYCKPNEAQHITINYYDSYSQTELNIKGKNENR